MPYITSVERIGLERGEQIGLQRGEQIGLHQGQRAMLRRMVQARFGTVPEALGREIDAADQGRLEQLADQIGAAASLDELDAASDRPG